MKLTQKEMNGAYIALGNIKLDKVAPTDIAKIMRARKEMRSHVEAYQAFDEDVRKAQPNYDLLVELEMKDKNRTDEEIVKYRELIPAFVAGVNEAIVPELEKEFDLNIEPISEDAVVQIISNNGLTLNDIEVIKCVIE